MQHGREFTILSGEPDWLTLTTAKGTSSYMLADWGFKRLHAQHKDEKRVPWKSMGYTGLRCGNISVGIRENDEAIVMVSGEMAKGMCLNTPAGGFKVTRFDLQVTVAIAPEYPEMALKEYQNLRVINASRTRKRYLKFIESNTGSTLYVGKRQSAVMLRFYDKTEAYRKGELGKYWRYEVEFKKGAAPKAYAAWIAAEDKIQHTMAAVTAEFSKRQFEPGFPLDTRIKALELSAKISTDETKLTWLQKCVSPVVVQLCYNGLTDEVVKALRLNNILNIKE